MSEPAPGVVYDDLPFYRKQWVAMISLFLFVPALIGVAATGPIYNKANKKQREQSSADVWLATSSGRTVMVISGIVVLLTGVARILMAGAA